MVSQELRSRLKEEALARIGRASQVEDIATVWAKLDGVDWPVRIRRRAGEYYEVSGRGSSMDLYLFNAGGDFLVCVPNYQRSGLVPFNCTGRDIMDYVGIENEVDAVTLAAALRYLMTEELMHGMICPAPQS